MFSFRRLSVRALIVSQVLSALFIAPSAQAISLELCERTLLPSNLIAHVQELESAGFKVELFRRSVKIEHSSEALRAWANVSDQTLRMGIYAKASDGMRLEGFSGKAMFDFFTQYFAGQFKYILGHWLAKSDNLEQFNILTRRPRRSLVEAAQLTWTGQQAMRHGYSDLKVLQKFGRRGDYWEVVVEFKKPRKR